MPRKDKELAKVADLGVSLHTALRKCCDSTPTSIAYNLISLDDFDSTWKTYLMGVLELGRPVTVDKLKAAMKSLPWGEAHRNALRCAFDLFSDDDWAGFVAFEEDEEQER